MQVFLPHKDVYRTARCLDKKRLHKQIIECKQILSALDGTSKGWRNHPVTKMYENHKEFLVLYMNCLNFFRQGLFVQAKEVSKMCAECLPSFVNDEYCDNFKRRLYTKDPIYYSVFEEFGTSYINMYFVNNEWKIYNQR